MHQAPSNFTRRLTVLAVLALGTAAAALVGGGCEGANRPGREASPGASSNVKARAAADKLLAGAEVVASGPGELAETFDAPGTLYVFDEATGVVVLRQGFPPGGGSFELTPTPTGFQFSAEGDGGRFTTSASATLPAGSRRVYYRKHDHDNAATGGAALEINPGGLSEPAAGN